MLATACILWSAMTALTSISNGLGLLIVFRIAQVIFESACNPHAYSLIADYFHPDRSGFANSLYSLGIYRGRAFSYLLDLDGDGPMG